MARYNTILPSGTYSTTTTIGTPLQGTFTVFTGTAPYTVIVPSATLNNGVSQVFYNNSSGSVTLSTNAIGTINTGGTNTSTAVMTQGSTLTMFSDGTNWIVVSNGGGGVVATTLTASSTVTLSPANTSVTISPTGTGTVLIQPASTLTIGTAGVSNPHVGNFVANTSNQTVTLSPAGTGGVTISPSGSATVVMNPTTTGAIDNVTIGSTTAVNVRGTTITATTQFSGPGTGLTGTAASLAVAWGNITGKPNSGTFFYATSGVVGGTYIYSNCGNRNSGLAAIYTYAQTGNNVGVQQASYNFNCNCNC